MQINVGGVISFSEEFPYRPSRLFPSMGPTALSFAVAPFWTAMDTRVQGQVRYKTFSTGGGSPEEEQALERVSAFVSGETTSDGFDGVWMLVASWENVQQFRRKDNPEMTSIVSCAWRVSPNKCQTQHAEGLSACSLCSKIVQEKGQPPN